MRQSGIPQTISTSRSTLLVLTTIAMILLPGAASAQAKRYPLESAERLRFHNVTAEPAMLQGKKGLKATISEEARVPWSRSAGLGTQHLDHRQLYLDYRQYCKKHLQ